MIAWESVEVGGEDDSDADAYVMSHRVGIFQISNGEDHRSPHGLKV